MIDKSKCEKLIEFVLFNVVLKNSVLFQLLIDKVGFLMLILSKFQIQKTNLWLFLSKRFKFMVDSLFFVFWEINLFRLQDSVQGQKGPTFSYFFISVNPCQRISRIPLNPVTFLGKKHPNFAYSTLNQRNVCRKRTQ